MTVRPAHGRAGDAADRRAVRGGRPAEPGSRPGARVAVLMACLLPAGPTLACGWIGGDGDRGPEVDAEERRRLEARVSALRDSFRLRLADDTLLRQVVEAEGDVLIGVRTAFLHDIAAWMSGTYLDRVRLHLEPDLVVEHEDEVKARVGPIRVKAGSWRVRVTIRSIQADLRVGSVQLDVADPSRLRATVAVLSEGGRGDVTVDFHWDAAAIPSLVCEDFEVREDLSGSVPPTRYRVDGVVMLEAVPGGIQATPDFSDSPLRVSPRPSEASWRRIRAILEEAKSGCGPLDPEDVVARLAEVFQRGFEFRLPESIFRPVLLPTRVRDRVEVAGRPVEITSTPRGLRVTQGAVWYGASLEAAAR